MESRYLKDGSVDGIQGKLKLVERYLEEKNEIDLNLIE